MLETLSSNVNKLQARCGKWSNVKTAFGAAVEHSQHLATAEAKEPKGTSGGAGEEGDATSPPGGVIATSVNTSTSPMASRGARARPPQEGIQAMRDKISSDALNKW